MNGTSRISRLCGASSIRAACGRSSVACVLLVVCFAMPARAGPCPFGVTPETAQRLFDRLKRLSVGDGYRFEGLGTEKSDIVVQWSRDGKDCPPIRGPIESCWRPLGLPTFRLDVSRDLGERCPGLQLVVQELSSVAAQQPTARFGALALGLVAALFIRCVGWIAVALTAAIPWLFNSADALTVGLGAARLIFAVLLFDRNVTRRRSRAEDVVLLGLFAVSFLMNWWLSSGGPGDLRLNLAAIWSSELDRRWGPAPIALFRLLGTALGGIQDSEIRCCNLLLSSLLPVLLYEIVVELGVSRPAALGAAFVAAAHPLLIAFSGVLEREPAYLFAACGSTLALIKFLKHGSWNQGTAFVLGAVLATTTRPEGAHVCVVYAAMLLLVPAPGWTRGVATLALMVLVSLAAAYVHFVVLSKPPSGYPLMARAPLLWTIVFDADFTPLAWIVAWVVGLVVGLRYRAAWVALMTLLGLHILWRWTGIYQMFVGHARQVASSRYEVILLLPFAIGVALFLQAVLAARPRVKVSLVAVFLAFTAATFPRSYDTLLRPFTIDYEYRFLKQHALSLPARSRLYVFDVPLDDVGFLDADLVGQFVGSPVSFSVWSQRRCDDLLGNEDTYLYIGSSCAELVDAPGRALSPDYARWWKNCESIRAAVAADTVERIEVPARKTSWNEFKNRTVPLALYRLRDASICVRGSETFGQP